MKIHSPKNLSMVLVKLEPGTEKLFYLYLCYQLSGRRGRVGERQFCISWLDLGACVGLS